MPGKYLGFFYYKRKNGYWGTTGRFYPERREKHVEKVVKDGRQRKAFQSYKRPVVGEQDVKLTFSHVSTRQEFLLTLLFFFQLSYNNDPQTFWS